MTAPPVERIVYLGTPAVAVPPLYALAEAGFDIPLVITNKDKRRGRGADLAPTPVKRAAEKLGIPVSHRTADAATVDADLGVVVAFGRIIRTNVLDAVPMVNIHFSLLPRWRGAAPVERAILAGDEVTGVSLMALAPELDTGDVYATQQVPITPNHTLESLRSELVMGACSMLVDHLKAGLGVPTPQEGEVTWAPKIAPEELHLDLHQSAVQLSRVVRLGRAWTTFRGKRLVLHEAVVHQRADGEPDLDIGELRGAVLGTGSGALRLVRVQMEGKPVLDVADWQNGARVAPEDRLGQ